MMQEEIIKGPLPDTVTPLKSKDTKNIFIVFEGLSGSGKTTLAKAVAEKLGALYIKPPLEPFSSIKSEIDEKASKLARAYFYLSGVIHTSDFVSEKLLSNSIVADKYIYTTVAFNRTRNIEIPILPLIKPDLAFYLEVNEEERLKRILVRDENLRYRAENMVERERKIENEFKRLDLIVINNNTTLDVVEKSVFAYINEIRS